MVDSAEVMFSEAILRLVRLLSKVFLWKAPRDPRVVATWLMAVKKPTHYVLYPAIFMVITTIGALAWQAYSFLTAPEPNLFLGITALVLIGLAVFVGNEGMQALKGRRVVCISTPEIPSRAE